MITTKRMVSVWVVLSVLSVLNVACIEFCDGVRHGPLNELLDSLTRGGAWLHPALLFASVHAAVAALLLWEIAKEGKWKLFLALILVLPLWHLAEAWVLLVMSAG